MKIRIITFHTPINYGAVLQAYSLFSYLKSDSNDTAVIDYNTQALRDGYPLMPKITSLKTLILFFLLLPFIRQKIAKRRKFRDFVLNYFSLTRRYDSTAELFQNPPEADVVITGSDQVFNPTRIEEERKAFYLDFVCDQCKRVSYAGSFGVNQVPVEMVPEIRGYFSGFDHISVRENSGKDIVMDLADRASTEVLDPVFLSDLSFWKALSKPYKKAFRDYVFYYRLAGGKAADDRAKMIASKLGKKLIVVTDGIMRIHADHVLRDVGPLEFLSLVDNADYVITNSFHGVAFSILYKKQFLALRVSDKKMGRQNTLLGKLGLMDRIEADEHLVVKAIDYDLVQQRLDDLIEASKEYLDFCLA